MVHRKGTENIGLLFSINYQKIRHSWHHRQTQTRFQMLLWHYTRFCQNLQLLRKFNHQLLSLKWSLHDWLRVVNSTFNRKVFKNFFVLLQVHSKEQHAIGLNGFKMIYDDKLPTLRPETISMLGLNLFSQLCQLSKITRTSGNEDNSNGNNIKSDQVRFY